MLKCQRARDLIQREIEDQKSKLANAQSRLDAAITAQQDAQQEIDKVTSLVAALSVDLSS